MNRPCKDCPFRTGVKPYLRAERCEEIRDSLEFGGRFPCHKTLDYSNGEPSPSGGTWCVGALLVMEAEGGAEMNQMVRIEGRLGMLPDLDELEGHDETFDSFDEWIEANS